MWYRHSVYGIWICLDILVKNCFLCWHQIHVLILTATVWCYFQCRLNSVWMKKYRYKNKYMEKNIGTIRGKTILRGKIYEDIFLAMMLDSIYMAAQVYSRYVIHTVAVKCCKIWFIVVSIILAKSWRTLFGNWGFEWLLCIYICR